MKERHFPPILFIISIIYGLTRWMLGYYTCDRCGENKNIFKSHKHDVCDWDIFRGYHHYQTFCDECYENSR